MNEIEFILQRFYLSELYTVGRLLLFDHRICNTLEDKVRDYNHDGDLLDAGEKKIFGETAIPFGRYEVTVSYSWKFKRDLPLLHAVRHFNYIRLHSGAHAGHTRGCILTGENKIKGGLVNGRACELKVTNLIKEYISKKNLVFINII